MTDAADELVYRGHGQAEVVEALQRWIRSQGPDLAATTVTSLWHPTHDGFSNVTVVLDLDERGTPDGPSTQEKVAVRLLNEHPLYDAMSLRRQYDDQIRLRACGLPVPEMRWFGTDDDVLGPELYAMAFVHGAIPATCPATTPRAGSPSCRRPTGPRCGGTPSTTSWPCTGSTPTPTGSPSTRPATPTR